MEAEEKSKEQKKNETKNGKTSQTIEVVDVDDDSMPAQTEVVQEAKPVAKPKVTPEAKPETKVQVIDDKDSAKNVSEEKENATSLAQKSKYDYSVPGKKCQDLSLSSRVSGRFWKSERDRFRSVIKSRGLKQVNIRWNRAQYSFHVDLFCGQNCY